MTASTNLPGPEGSRDKRSRYWLRRFALLLVLLIPLAIWRGCAALDNLPIPARGDAPRVQAQQPVYVAILGVDERHGDSGRADTLILGRLDQTSQELDVINIPRDTRITFSTGTQSKINAAFAIGGGELVTEVVADLLGIPRPYYVTVNFQAFTEIVNLVGGVEIDVDRHYQYEDPYQDLFIDIRPGKQTMYGETALKFVRIRYDGITNSDIARIERQQQFLAALKAKLLSPSYWTRIPSMLQSVRTHLATNIPEADQLMLAQQLFRARNHVRMVTLPGFPDDGTGDWLLDPKGWSEVTESWQED